MSLNYGCNDNEAAVLAAFDETPVLTLGELAEKCPSGKLDHTSWARNSLRKPVKHGLIAKVGRGRYEVTPKLATFNGKALAEARKEARLSQEQVRAMIGASSRQRVSDLERGAKRPGLVELYALCAAVQVRLPNLFPVVEALEVLEAQEPAVDDWSEVGGVKAVEPSEEAAAVA
jgi:transcriptional regulator with XRE-family HTH domain